jgi:hypothetical protein
LIDSKGASNADTKYLIKIDGKGVDYKVVANNLNARILIIDFSKDNRFVEILGTQMASYTKFHNNDQQLLAERRNSLEVQIKIKRSREHCFMTFQDMVFI